MKKVKIIPFIAISFIALMFFSCSNNNDSDNSDDTIGLLEAKTELNVSYGNNSQQVYDIYLPAGRSSSSTKTLIIIHGGGWTSGDKADVDGLVNLM